MLDTEVEDMGKIFVGCELGGGGTSTPETVSITEIGVRNLLAHFEIIDEKPLSCEDRGLPPIDAHAGFRLLFNQQRCRYL